MFRPFLRLTSASSLPIRNNNLRFVITNFQVANVSITKGSRKKEWVNKVLWWSAKCFCMWERNGANDKWDVKEDFGAFYARDV